MSLFMFIHAYHIYKKKSSIIGQEFEFLENHIYEYVFSTHSPADHSGKTRSSQIDKLSNITLVNVNALAKARTYRVRQFQRYG